MSMPGKTQPAKLTVLMSVYNGDRYLHEAVDSILAQTFSDFEFLIINDGSTDGTRDILESYADPRIRLIHQENRGLTRSLNRGLRLAKSDIIARMDADDVSSPDRLEAQMRVFVDRPDVSLVTTGSRVLWPDGERVRVPRFSETALPALLLSGDLLCGASMAYRREAVLAVGGYDNEFYCAQDYDLWLRFAWKGYRFGAVERPLYIVRKHEASISATKKALQQRSDLRATRRVLRWIRRDPGAFKWVDAQAVREALVGLSWKWSSHKPAAARAAARTLVAVSPQDVIGYKLLLASLPGVQRLRQVLSRITRAKGTGGAGT